MVEQKEQAPAVASGDITLTTSMLDSYSSVLDYFTCPICTGTLDNTHFTSCGHRFCHSCIEECINRRSQCPLCMGNLTIKMITKDFQFDELKTAILSERSKSEENYFKYVAEQATQNAFAKTHKLDPIEMVLHKHLKNSLAAFEHYQHKLRLNHSRKITDYLQKANLEKSRTTDSPKVKSCHSEIDTYFSSLKESADNDLMQSINNLAASFDKFLSTNLPQPSALPVKVNILVEHLDKLEVKEFEIEPMETIEKIKPRLQECIIKLDYKMVNYGEDIKFQIYGNKIYNTSPRDKMLVTLTTDSRPVIEYGLQYGERIYVSGSIILESDLPKQCIVATFKEGAVLDYFTCLTCKINWVCNVCVETCHMAHDTKPYISGHTPHWACCYCQRKKVCKLPT